MTPRAVPLIIPKGGGGRWKKIFPVGGGVFHKSFPGDRGKRNLCFPVGGWVSH